MGGNDLGTAGCCTRSPGCWPGTGELYQDTLEWHVNTKIVCCIEGRTK